MPIWTTYHNGEFAYSVRFPASWYRARTRLTPFLAEPREILSLASYPLRVDGGRCAQLPTNALHDLGASGALVVVFERMSNGSPPGPEFKPRPKRFSLALGYPTEARNCVVPRGRFSDGEIAIKDRTRAFYVFFALGPQASRAERAQLLAILNSLRFSPRRPA